MKRADMQVRWFPAFAALTADSRARTVADDHRWVQRVGEREFADELIVAAVAQELRIKIILIPYTPAAAGRPWVISEYKPMDLEVPAGRTIYLGNNDVHYVLLAQTEA